jgi:hypothetical protein
MAKRKRWTPEEWRAWREEHAATQHLLRRRIELAKAELAAKRKTS